MIGKGRKKIGCYLLVLTMIFIMIGPNIVAAPDTYHSTSTTIAYVTQAPAWTTKSDGTKICIGTNARATIWGWGEHTMELVIDYDVNLESGPYSGTSTTGPSTHDLSGHWNICRILTFPYEGHEFIDGDFTAKIYVDGVLKDTNFAHFTQKTDAVSGDPNIDSILEPEKKGDNDLFLIL